jgi:PAS domain S-box-containing protein
MLTLNEYKSLIEQAPVMIWRADRNKLCDYCNQQWLDFTGKTLEEVTGNGWMDSVHPEDHEECLKVYTKSFDRRSAFELNYRLRRVDGVYRWIFDKGIPHYDEQGEFQGYVGIGIDITEKVEAEQLMQQQKQREIDQLKTYLPICAWCKKIRTDDGHWYEIEDYFAKEKISQITHGICDDCAQQLRQRDPSAEGKES